jgi:hypothetical protein
MENLEPFYQSFAYLNVLVYYFSHKGFKLTIKVKYNIIQDVKQILKHPKMVKTYFPDACFDLLYI